MAVDSLVTCTFQNNDSSTRDETRFQLVVETAAPLTGSQLQGIWQEFFNNHGGTHGLGAYLASCVSRTIPGALFAYDITAHLDGSPHGSPYASSSVTIDGAVSDSRGNQLCAVFAFVDSFYSAVPTSGPTVSIPTPESAQDAGAPATHLGTNRPKSRHANRMYFGPVSADAIGVDGNANPQWTDTFMADAHLALHTFAGNVDTLPGAPIWMVWSRRNAQVEAVASGWVDRGIKTRRRKAFSPNLRSAF